MAIKLATFNIRYDTERDEQNSFHYRRELIVKKIKKEAPDVICFQEVLPHMAVWLKENLKDYYIVGCGRSKRLKDEQVAVAYRYSRMNPVQMETFWLSDTPQVPGSRYEEQSVCPRLCTEVVFQDLDTDEMFRLVNLHLDHSSSKVRAKEIRQILDKAEKAEVFSDIPVILAGDFYAQPEMEEMALLLEHPKFCEITGETGGTYHGFGRMETPMKTDYIFVQKPFVCENLEVWKDCKNGVYLSDHYPICVTLTGEKEQ